MSWLFSRALVEAYSEATCLDGEPCAPSSGTPTPQAYSSHGKMTDFSRLSRFGMTCSPLTDDHGEAVLTWCLEASLARTSASQAKALESMESDPACGDTWRGSFARLDRDSSSWKTRQPSLFEDLIECSVTWPRWGTMRNGACSERTMPVLRTSANESGLWPTPVADGDRATNCAQGGTSLGFAVRMWPTPRTTGLDGGSNSRKAAKARGMWPTPTAGDAKSSGSRNTANSKAHPGISLTDAVRNDGGTGRTEGGGPLNPTWVEWLMGWPLGWTDFAPLETAKFRAWQHLLGACSPKVSSPPAAAGEPDVADPSGGGTKNSRDA